MRTDDFSYDLPESLIAQQPLYERDQCRLLLMDRKSEALRHLVFTDLERLLVPGDRLVFNDTKVIPARLYARKDTGGLIEFLFTERISPRQWNALISPARRMKAGTAVRLEGFDAFLRVTGICHDGARSVILECSDPELSIDAILEKTGKMPLPPYIRRDADFSDRENYQTVYAKVPGAIAAPTAGLHFTPSLMNRLARKGIGFSYVTLHVGIGTFRPVKTEDPLMHEMHEEQYELPEKTVKEILGTRREGGRIIAVGTTTVRVLEQCSPESGALAASKGFTRLFLYPSYRFRIVDGLITNFHLPRSTLLMLVSAFATREGIVKAYTEAVKEKYRFFSYGDAMFIM